MCSRSHAFTGTGINQLPRRPGLRPRRSARPVKFEVPNHAFIIRAVSAPPYFGNRVLSQTACSGVAERRVPLRHQSSGSARCRRCRGGAVSIGVVCSSMSTPSETSFRASRTRRPFSMITPPIWQAALARLISLSSSSCRQGRVADHFKALHQVIVQIRRRVLHVGITPLRARSPARSIAFHPVPGWRSSFRSGHAVSRTTGCPAGRAGRGLSAPNRDCRAVLSVHSRSPR